MNPLDQAGCRPFVTNPPHDEARALYALRVEERRRGTRGAMGAGAIVIGAALVLSAVAVAAEQHRHPRNEPLSFGYAFCGKKTKPVNTFGLDRLAPLPGLPADGALPFAPKTVSIGGSGTGRVLPPGGSFGFDLFSENYVGRTPLHWTVNVRAVALGDGGRQVDAKVVPVKTISAGSKFDFYMGPFRRPGFYRYDFEILDREHERLALYREHVKVFAHTYWDVRLAVNSDFYRPEEVVFSRPENFGTETAYFGESFGVQAWDGQSWVRKPEMTPGRWRKWGGGAGPGSPGRCSALRLPQATPAGRYRIVKRVGTRLERGGRYYQVTAEFEVVPNWEAAVPAWSDISEAERRQG